MKVRLTVLKGPEGGRVFEVADGQKRLIGRSSKSDITISDMSISRIHCQVTNDGQQCVLQDLNSKNGVIVNGARIAQPRRLAEGDVVELGTCVLKVEMGGAGTPTSGLGGEGVSEVGKEIEKDLAALEAPPRGGKTAPAGETPAGEVRGERVAGSKPKSPSNRRSVSGPGEDAGSLMGAFDSWLGEGKEARREPPATEETLGILSPEKGDEQEGEVIPLEVEEPVEPQEIPLELEPEPSPGFRSESEVVELEAVTEDPRIGTVIGGCRIEERIGRDALSVIYRATQLSVARPVELRVLAEPLARDAAAVQRFLAAACAGGRLTHPHILQVYDAGGANSLYYVALEAMDGLTVRQLLKQRGSLPVETVLEIGIQIASALAHAHAQGICHGSIGLGNILVTRHGIAKLAELGFTQGLEDAGRRAGRGVSQFTAPEQLQFPHVTEPPADIYALGAVLFVLFSGRFPFRGRTEGELEQKIVSGRHESLQQLQPSLPAELCKVVERAMSPRPADRRPDAAALQQELTAIRDGLH